MDEENAPDDEKRKYLGKQTVIEKPAKHYFWGIIFVISPLLGIVSYSLLAGAIWSQAAYFPYPYPEPWITPIRFGLYAAFGFAFLSVFLLIRIGFKLIKGRQLRIHNRRGLKAFMAVWAIGLIAGSGAMLYFAIPRLQYWLYDSEPYLVWGNGQDPSDSITVCWHSSTYTFSEVKYGTTADALIKSARSDQYGQYHHVAISDLSPNTTYFYQIRRSSVYNFTTAAQGAHNFTYVYWADPRENNPLSSALKGPNMPKAITEHFAKSGTKIAFGIAGGDITSRGVDYETWKLWFDDISTNGFSCSTPIQIVAGNHERHDDSGGRNFAKYYPYEKNAAGFSYSFDYGNVHFTVLDPWNEEYRWYGDDDTKYAEWLEKDLQDAADAKFRVLNIHPNPLLNDGHDGNCTQIMDVARNYGVDLILCGHWHSYNTWFLNGTVVNKTAGINDVPNLCMMIGMGGNTDDLNYAAYCQIDVTPDSIWIRPRWINGDWFESYLIQK